MLLHSIMGVGTNCFPMALEKLPALRDLLSTDEMRHVEAFPTVLRLLIHGPLLQELSCCDANRLRQLRGLRMRRLLDNAPISLTGEELWVHLNLQMIHSLDFLPAGGWKRTCNEYFFALFLALHELLCAQARLSNALADRTAHALSTVERACVCVRTERLPCAVPLLAGRAVASGARR